MFVEAKQHYVQIRDAETKTKNKIKIEREFDKVKLFYTLNEQRAQQIQENLIDKTVGDPDCDVTESEAFVVDEH